MSQNGTRRRPIIGIPAALSTSETGYVQQQVGSPYVQALVESGGVPVALPVNGDPGVMSSLLALVDGVVFQGGGDIWPRLYGQETRPEVKQFKAETDEFELDFCRLCIEEKIPVLAVCRGVQVLNVALGGTLIQDLPSQRPSSVLHRQLEPRSVPTHVIHIEGHSHIVKILGATELCVNSFHHQAIEEIGSGLIVTARSEDGVIEAVEMPSELFVVGVQFHPEETIHTVEPTAHLFQALVEAARKFRSQRTAKSETGDA